MDGAVSMITRSSSYNYKYTILRALPAAIWLFVNNFTFNFHRLEIYLTQKSIKLVLLYKYFAIFLVFLHFL